MSLPSNSQLRLSMARFLKAPDIARTTRSLPWAKSSAIMGRPFSRRTVARIYRPYWRTRAKMRAILDSFPHRNVVIIINFYLRSICQHTGSGWHQQQPPAPRGSCFLSAVMCKHGPPLAGITAHNLKEHRKTLTYFNASTCTNTENLCTAENLWT